MWRIYFLLSLIIILTGSLCETAVANEYEIPEIRIETIFLENGTVRITEHLTYRFEGSFSWADHRFSKRGFDTLSNIAVSENGMNYINDNSEDTGTFSVSESNRNVIIKWHYSAQDTSRTFTISYELKGALVVGNEWVEFFWNYLASGRNKPTDRFSLELTLPSSVSTDSVYVWDRLESDHLKVISPEGTIAISASDISRNQTARLRFLVPRSLFDENSIMVTEPELTLENVLMQEHEYETEQQERAEYAEWIRSISEPVTAVITVLSILFFVLLYNRYGKRYKSNLISDKETIMIPDQTPPALVGKLLSSSITTHGHLMATIFDLARRGYFKIREAEKEKKGLFTKTDTEFLIEPTDRNPEQDRELAEWELMVYRFVNGRIRFGSTSIKNLFSESPAKVSKWFTGWKKEVRKVYDGQNWVDLVSTKGVAFNIILQSVLIAASLYLLFNEAGIAVIALVTTGIMLLMSMAIKRRTKAGQEIYKRWNAYRKGLKNVDKRTIRMETLDKHFIYATALGLTPNHIESLLQKADDSQLSAYLPWIVLYSGSTSSPASIAQSVSSLAATGGSTFSGSIGGTGASMGSAGGGASSGAG